MMVTGSIYLQQQSRTEAMDNVSRLRAARVLELFGYVIHLPCL